MGPVGDFLDFRMVFGLICTPLKISGCNVITELWKIIFLSKWVICRFHLPGCILYVYNCIYIYISIYKIFYLSAYYRLIL